MYVHVHEVVVHSHTHVLQTEKKEIECRRGLEPISHLGRPQSEMDITAQCQYNNIPTKAMDSQADWCIVSFTTTPGEDIEYPNTLYTTHMHKKTYTQDTHAQDAHTQKRPLQPAFQVDTSEMDLQELEISVDAVLWKILLITIPHNISHAI